MDMMKESTAVSVMLICGEYDRKIGALDRL